MNKRNINPVILKSLQVATFQPKYKYIKLPYWNQSNPSFHPLNRQKYSVQNREVQTGCNRLFNSFSGHFSRLENEYMREYPVILKSSKVANQCIFIKLPGRTNQIRRFRHLTAKNIRFKTMKFKLDATIRSTHFLAIFHGLKMNNREK